MENFKIFKYCLDAVQLEALKFVSAEVRGKTLKIISTKDTEI